jgi:hypothetical protein
MCALLGYIVQRDRPCWMLMQLFEAVETVASPQSPGSRPAPHVPPSDGSSVRAAQETAEAQASASSNCTSRLATSISMAKRSVGFTPDVVQRDGDSASLSNALRQASIASCASEWVEPRTALCAQGFGGAGGVPLKNGTTSVNSDSTGNGSS